MRFFCHYVPPYLITSLPPTLQHSGIYTGWLRVMTFTTSVALCRWHWTCMRRSPGCSSRTAAVKCFRRVRKTYPHSHRAYLARDRALFYHSSTSRHAKYGNKEQVLVLLFVSLPQCLIMLLLTIQSTSSAERHRSSKICTSQPFMDMSIRDPASVLKKNIPDHSVSNLQLYQKRIFRNSTTPLSIHLRYPAPIIGSVCQNLGPAHVFSGSVGTGPTLSVVPYVVLLQRMYHRCYTSFNLCICLSVKQQHRYTVLAGTVLSGYCTPVCPHQLGPH